MTQVEFRKKLDEVTKESPFRQPRLIDNLKNQYNHNITLCSNSSFIDQTEDCFKYVFKDKVSEDTRNKINHLIQKKQWIFKDVIHSLISRGFLSLHNLCEPDDKIVVYFKEDSPRHFGIINDNKIISKWGQGHVWKHDLYEVPLSYGDTAKYSIGTINESLLRELVIEKL